MRTILIGIGCLIVLLLALVYLLPSPQHDDAMTTPPTISTPTAQIAAPPVVMTPSAAQQFAEVQDRFDRLYKSEQQRGVVVERGEPYVKVAVPIQVTP